MVIAGAGDTVTEQALELVDGADHRGAEHQELHVVVRRLARVERLFPRSSLMLQLRCLPEPFTPANGFSCSRHASPYFGAIRRIISIVII